MKLHRKVFGVGDIPVATYRIEIVALTTKRANKLQMKQVIMEHTFLGIFLT